MYINCSLVLEGNYIEVLGDNQRFSFSDRVVRHQGDIIFRMPSTLHRIELMRSKVDVVMPVTTMFITGPRMRDWGFACPNGWVDHMTFLNRKDNYGRGCQ